MKVELCLCVAVVLCCMVFCGQLTAQPQVANHGVPKIIFDTDMGPDFDDIGAIAILHALADSGECRILATVSCNAHPSIAPTIELLNRYFGREGLPVAAAVQGAPNLTAPNNWNDRLINIFAPDIRASEYPDAVNVYRRILASQPDNSVTIVTVGFLSNISAFLDSQPDEYSKLNGVDLVKAKVKQLVAMAGIFPEGREFNVYEHTLASINTFNKWPKRILFSGFEIGIEIHTGDRVAKQGGDSPVADGYAYSLKTYFDTEKDSHASFDQTAVLIAIRKPEEYFYVHGPGKLVVREDGSNIWDPTADADHYFISHKYPYNFVAETIEALMLHRLFK